MHPKAGTTTITHLRATHNIVRKNLSGSRWRTGVRTPPPPLLKNHKNIGFLSNTGSDSLKKQASIQCWATIGPTIQRGGGRDIKQQTHRLTTDSSLSHRGLTRLAIVQTVEIILSSKSCFNAKIIISNSS